MFKGSGLEINMTLLNSKYCMMRPPVSGGAQNTVVYTRLAADSYSISNIFLGLVYHESIDSGIGLHYQIPFTSVY